MRVSAMDPQADRFEHAILLAFKSDKGRAVELRLPQSATRSTTGCNPTVIRGRVHRAHRPRGARVREECTSAAVLYAGLDPLAPMS